MHPGLHAVCHHLWTIEIWTAIASDPWATEEVCRCHSIGALPSDIAVGNK
jgi:hypothetical protein